MNDVALENARDYYGKVLTGSQDLRTDACTTGDPPPAAIRRALGRVHDEVRRRYYGCGLIAPSALEGARILDLGCGAGQDGYVLAQLVGPTGDVVGIDATREQLEVARRHEEWHRVQFDYDRSNVTFLEGDIARLEAAGLEPASFDVIVSNCVINLVEDKAAVFAAARTLLKPGGELYFSDVYADRRTPAHLRRDPVLHGECLAGALYWGDFLELAKAAGFGDPRLVSDRRLSIGDPHLADLTAPIAYYSATWRLFNLERLEPACEDYGQAVRYRGTVPGAEAVFRLDKHHAFEARHIEPVCGNTVRMLAESRFAAHFEFYGDTSRHFGRFKGCGSEIPFDAGGEAAPVGACC